MNVSFILSKVSIEPLVEERPTFFSALLCSIKLQIEFQKLIWQFGHADFGLDFS